MAWIELHETIKNHRKIYALMSDLSVNKPTAIGILVLLWTWALDAAEDGDLSAFPPRAIADATDCRKSPSKLVDALVSSGWLDRDEEGIRIHDWYEYAGRLIERRKEERAYKKRRYALYSDMRLTRAVKARDGDRCRYCGIVVNWNDKKGLTGGTYDHVDPNGDNSEDNIVVACRSCNSKKGGRTQAEAKMNLLPAPTKNSQIKGKSQAENGQKISAITVPNRTIPIDDDEEDARARARLLLSQYYQDVFGAPPTPAQVDDLCRWLDKLPVDVVQEAIHRAALSNARSPTAYAFETLRNWYAVGHRTLLDVQGAEADWDAKMGRI